MRFIESVELEFFRTSMHFQQGRAESSGYTRLQKENWQTKALLTCLFYRAFCRIMNPDASEKLVPEALFFSREGRPPCRPTNYFHFGQAGAQ